jgi:hypothetical protein
MSGSRRQRSFPVRAFDRKDHAPVRDQPAHAAGIDLIERAIFFGTCLLTSSWKAA